MSFDALVPLGEVLERQLRDPEVRAAWQRLAPARAVANRLIAYRAEHGLTQTALGRLLGMPQSAIARLEAGEHLPSLQSLLRLTETLGLEIVVSMTPPEQDGNGSALEERDAVIEERVTTPGGASLRIAIR
jgi:transcriptional regulator with XRE-family HTH domain